MLFRRLFDFGIVTLPDKTTMS